MTITPNAMPGAKTRKVDPLHTQILGELLNPKSKLAPNVSNFNVELAAKRWAR